MYADSLILGAGMHGFDRDRLNTYRQAVIDPDRGASLAETAATVERSGPYRVGEASRKAVPKEFDPQHERAKFLLYEGLTAMFETPVPPEARSAAFVDYCLEHFKAVNPINAWLREALRSV